MYIYIQYVGTKYPIKNIPKNLPPLNPWLLHHGLPILGRQVAENDRLGPAQNEAVQQLHHTWRGRRRPGVLGHWICLA